MLWVLGWKADPSLPDCPCAVVIAAPHTSNWDGPIMLAVAWSLGVKMNWMGKHTLFKRPFGFMVRALGGIPIDRRKAHGIVGEMRETFERTEKLWVAVPPEGTRAKVEYWKSGFYAIAYEAKVPVVLGYLDFGRKVGGIGPMVPATGDVRGDMDKVREFYEGMMGKRPECMSEIHLRAEKENQWPPVRDKDKSKTKAQESRPSS